MDEDIPMMVIVPASLDAAISTQLDVALVDHQDATAEDRDGLRRELLSYFSKFGRLPAFEVVKKVQQ